MSPKSPSEILETLRPATRTKHVEELLDWLGYWVSSVFIRLLVFGPNPTPREVKRFEEILGELASAGRIQKRVKDWYSSPGVPIAAPDVPWSPAKSTQDVLNSRRLYELDTQNLDWDVREMAQVAYEALGSDVGLDEALRPSGFHTSDTPDLNSYAELSDEQLLQSAFEQALSARSRGFQSPFGPERIYLQGSTQGIDPDSLAEYPAPPKTAPLTPGDWERVYTLKAQVEKLEIRVREAKERYVPNRRPVLGPRVDYWGGPEWEGLNPNSYAQLRIRLADKRMELLRTLKVSTSVPLTVGSSKRGHSDEVNNHELNRRALRKVTPRTEWFFNYSPTFGGNPDGAPPIPPSAR